MGVELAPPVGGGNQVDEFRSEINPWIDEHNSLIVRTTTSESSVPRQPSSEVKEPINVMPESAMILLNCFEKGIGRLCCMKAHCPPSTHRLITPLNGFMHGHTPIVANNKNSALSLACVDIFRFTGIKVTTASSNEEREAHLFRQSNDARKNGITTDSGRIRSSVNEEVFQQIDAVCNQRLINGLTPLVMITDQSPVQKLNRPRHFRREIPVDHMRVTKTLTYEARFENATYLAVKFPGEALALQRWKQIIVDIHHAFSLHADPKGRFSEFARQLKRSHDDNAIIDTIHDYVDSETGEVYLPKWLRRG